MRAVYDIRDRLDKVIANVTLDVSSDPASHDSCTVALYSWGYDPHEHINAGKQPIYYAMFIGYEGGVMEVPVVAIEAIEQLMSDVPYQTLKQTEAGRTLFLRLRRIANMLLESGCTTTTLNTD